MAWSSEQPDSLEHPLHTDPVPQTACERVTFPCNTRYPDAAAKPPSISSRAPVVKNPLLFISTLFKDPYAFLVRVTYINPSLLVGGYVRDLSLLNKFRSGCHHPDKLA